MTLKINPADLAKLQKKLNSIEQMQTALRPPMKQSLAVSHVFIAEYFPKAQGAFTRLATPRQKKAYWARVGSGEIDHGPNGYRRTGTTGRKWTERVEQVRNGLVGELGNNAEAARFMHSHTDQQPFHKATGFRTDKETLEAKESEISRFFKRAIDKELAK